MNIFHTARHRFKRLSTIHRMGLLIFLSLILMASVFLCYRVLSPDFAILFQHLEERDASQIISQLEEDNIAYQLKSNGSEVLIDKNLIAKTRLKIMGSGVSLRGSVGFELFDKNDFGMTDFSQKINYQRALQGELERTISSLDEVRQARVHLNIPQNHLFAKEINQPTAAVTLQVKSALTSKQVRSMQQLIAASVAHLSAKNVVVVDQNGTTLSQTKTHNATRHFARKQSIERYLNDKVMQILNKIFTKNQVLVKIDVALNYDELQRELVKPHTQGQISHEKESKHSTLSKKDKNPRILDLTREKTYRFGSEKEVFKRASGTIERLSVSVVLPQNTDERTRAQVQRLVKSTVGFSEKRGDVISVEALIGTESDSMLPDVPVLVPSSPLDTVLQAYANKTTSVSLPCAVLEKSADKAPNSIQAMTQMTRVARSMLILVLCAAIASTGVLLIRRARQKKRQSLLLELSHWLNQYE